MTYIYIVLGILLVLFIFSKIAGGGLNIEGIDASQAKNMIQSKDFTIIDVRTPAEIAQGKIKNALEMNVQSPNFRKALGKLDKKKKYLVYCRSGRRSMLACQMMKKSGIDQVINLSGGYNAYKKLN